MTYTEACVAINMVPKVGPVRLRRLLAKFVEPQAILQASADRLATVEGIGPEIARGIASWESQVDLPAELTRATTAGVRIITSQSQEYPALLRTIHDPPMVLYVWGEMDARDARAVGIVGSRKTTFYGTETTKKLSYQLAFAGFTIFSGLARGIDTAAHQGALAAQGRTVAVMGCGLGEIYPPENFELADRIAGGSGAVISEFPMLVKPDRQTFPMRNRIISGCSLGLLVIEAGLNSGALISANQAVEQGRTVFAVPGPIDRPNSQGSNRLIQQGAKLVMDSSDVLEELNALPGLFAPTSPVAASEDAPPTSDRPSEMSGEVPAVIQVTPDRPQAVSSVLGSKELSVYEAVESDETPIDRIISKCGLPTSVVSSTLLALELKRLVKQLPGKHYVRLG